MMIMRNIPYYHYYSLNLLFFFLFINTTSILLLVSSSSSSCHSQERTALLQFKQLFSINCKPNIYSSYLYCDPDTHLYKPSTDSWIEGTDCCAWKGVECDDETGHVVELDLDEGCLYGTIPPNSTLFDLLHLQVLVLSCNNFNSSQISPSFGRLRNLTTLNLSYSNLSGQTPSDFHLPNLVRLFLAGNRISGQIPSSLSNFLDLEYLDLSSNELSGTIEPYMFGKKLRILVLSSNKLTGTIKLDTFAKLENLTTLDLSNSGLSLTTANYVHSSITFQNIESLALSSCNLSSTPFALLKNPNYLLVLDLKNNNINEQLHPLICNMSSLVYLDLSNNQFYGLLPDCLGNIFGLLELKLQRNNFNGNIPQTLGYGRSLEALDISHNQLQGLVPRSLASCSYLRVLNLGHNSIKDVFPSWLESLEYLEVLVLRHNNFYGPIEPPPRKKSFFNGLRIIDVSHNDFIGTLPAKYFESWDSMMVAEENASQLPYMLDSVSGYGISEFYSVTIMNKGQEMDFVKLLTALTVVDFSYNKLHGKILISLGRLKGLRVLNFSGNAFTGPIPLFLKNLTNLESLDLSRNKLFGEIPQQLTSLTFLEIFDVSQNNLTGLIPRVRQFETFPNTSYEGNPGLCGFPLSKNCGNIKVPTSPFKFSHESKFKVDGFCWEIVVIGYGCGLVIGLVIGSWIIKKREEWLEKKFHLKMHSRGKRSKKIK